MSIVTRFDINKPILSAMIDEAEGNGGNLPDYIYTQMLDEYGADEQDVMNQMIASTTHAFNRSADGWIVANI